MPNEPVDVLIIGAGASGAAVAWSLAETKMHILCLEQGDWMKPSEYPSSGRDWEARLFSDFAINPNRRARETDRDTGEDAEHDPRHPAPAQIAALPEPDRGHREAPRTRTANHTRAARDRERLRPGQWCCPHPSYNTLLGSQLLPHTTTTIRSPSRRSTAPVISAA